MKRCWIERSVRRPICPMTPMVSGRGPLPDCPGPRPPEGWPVYCVEIDGFVFRFADFDEIDVLTETFERRILPQTRPTSHNYVLVHSRHGGWLNQHWLSRLPARVKPYRYRLKAAAFLRRSAEAFRRQQR